MITIDKIRVEDNLQIICNFSFDVFFYGTELDERTETIISEINIKPAHKISFMKDEYLFFIDDISYRLISLESFFDEKSYKKILIDSTSLDFPELLYLLNALNNSKHKFQVTIIYVEPLEYSNTIDDDQEKYYQLSDKMHPFSALPLFAVNTQSSSNSEIVLTPFLGFENSRLGQVLVNDDSATFKKITPCISVPAYSSGWENISLKKHLKYFKAIPTDLRLYPGANPYAVNELLEEIYEHYQKIVITSLGTKPTAIGISVFLINNISKNTEDRFVGAVYDFPIKARGRSRGVGVIHTYKLSL